MYDLIGDIHGHADELVCLLTKLGYECRQGVYGHSERQVIFLGDFIDRGPQIREVLEIVRLMVDEGKALAVMGNHELNALAYHTEDLDRPGEYLRPHGPKDGDSPKLRNKKEKNAQQHHQTISQLEPAVLNDYLNWFRTLPLCLDLGGLRVVHACWDAKVVDMIVLNIRHSGVITNEFLRSACKKGNDLFAPVEVILKGKEAELPEGKFFVDKDGHRRTAIRTRWYLSPEGRTYGNYALQADPVDCDTPLTDEVIGTAVPYPPDEKPVFVGHYWLSADRPKILADNVVCLDFSVAKGGYLCAYRWDGEHKLDNDKFVWSTVNSRHLMKST